MFELKKRINSREFHINQAIKLEEVKEEFVKRRNAFQILAE